jgi:hypothetical protein
MSNGAFGGIYTKLTAMLDGALGMYA